MKHNHCLLGLALLELETMHSLRCNSIKMVIYL